MRTLLLLLLSLVALVASPALARTLAVLPLEKGAGSEAYDGLGLALAGMLTTDLAQADGVQLVERGRLDAVLAELKLGEGGFLDPATAQRLGKGLGAELVVVGSYSVVAQTFLLDARVVEVQSGKVLDAGAANGTVEDFVSVEKELVEGLVARLELQLTGAQRRSILGAAPTAQFPAFAAYGGGLEAQRRGDFDAAKQRFEVAISADPAYEEARAALADLRAKVEAIRAVDRASAVSELDKRLLAGVDAAPDARTLKSIPTDLVSTARFAVRFQALKLMNRDCQRYEELLAYGRGLRWKVTYPEGAPSRPVQTKSPLLTEILIQGEAVGMIPVDDRYDTYRDDDLRLSTTSPLWRSATELAIGYTQDDPDRDTRYDLLGSLWRCFPDEERPARVHALRQELLAAGLGDEVVDPKTYNVTTADRLLLLDARTQAGQGSVDRVTLDALDQLLAKYPADDRAAELYPHMWALRAVESVAKALDKGQERQRALLGLSPARFAAAYNALRADGDPAALSEDTPVCHDVVPMVRQELTRWSKPPAALSADRLSYSEVLQTSALLASLVDFGCVVGAPARVTTVEEGLALAASASSRALTPKDPQEAASCAEDLQRLVRQSAPDYLPASSTDAVRHGVVSAALRSYHHLITKGCVAEAAAAR